MELEIEETGPVERKLKIEIPTADVDAAFDGVYRDLAKHAAIPGFRRGRIPRSVMQRYFGERARSEVLERLVRESLPRALEDADLAVVGEPQLAPSEPPREGAPFAYEAKLDLRPEIELQKVRGLEVEEPVLPEPDEDPVERRLEELRLEQAQLVEEDEGVTAARGHVAVVDYAGTIDGEPFEGGSGREALLDLGAGRAIAGLEDEILGMAVGSERTFDLDLPEDYPSPGVAGRRARFEVKLVGLKRRELAELDDEFAKDVSELDTLDELRARLRERLDAARGEELERRRREAVLDALLDANPFPVPQGLVEDQLNRRLAGAARSLRELPDDEFTRVIEDFRRDWRPRVERDVRLAFLVPRIAEAEGIEASEADVDAELRTLAEREQQSLGALKRKYREEGLLEAVRRRVLEERVLAFLLSEATLSEPKPP